MKTKLKLVVRVYLSLCAVSFCMTALCVEASQKKATLSTTYGSSIYDNELKQMIDKHITNSAKRLVVLTQCYGGDALEALKNTTNTAVISATSRGQKAYYGGYDDDAATATKPGAGRTGQTVHDAGVAGKHGKETPQTGGTLSPGNFPLAPVTDDGDVRSRHVVVYAGQPDNKPGRDVTQRDLIKSNFAGQANTTVTTVGGGGPAAGWDKHGWRRGLNDAIKEAGEAIATAPDPSKEQFLLFVTDHGDLHTVTNVSTRVAANDAVTVSNVQSFTSLDFEEPVFENPGFSITINLYESGFV